MRRDEILETLKSDSEALQQLGVASLKLFGSASRDNAGPGSDLDFLVRFKNAASYDQFMDLKDHLEGVFSMKIDLVTEDALRPELREAVERDALLIA